MRLRLYRANFENKTLLWKVKKHGVAICWMLEFIACSEYFAGYDSTILQKSNNPYKCSKQVFVRMCNIRFIVNKNIPPAQLGRKHNAVTDKTSDEQRRLQRSEMKRKVISSTLMCSLHCPSSYLPQRLFLWVTTDCRISCKYPYQSLHAYRWKVILPTTHLPMFLFVLPVLPIYHRKKNITR